MATLEELRNLYGRVHICRQCPGVQPSLCARKVDPRARDAQLALMAQAPSEGGVRKSGMHWVGEDVGLRRPGGVFLNRFLKAVGHSVDPADTQCPRPYTTDVLHCWTGRSGKRDRRPSSDELHRCKRWWVAELGLIRPRAIVLLGKPASEAFARVCGVDTDFSAMLREQGPTVTFGDLAILRFVLPHPTAPYPGKSGLYADVFSRVLQVLGT